MANPASESATVTVIGDIDSTLTGISGEMLAWRKSEALGEHFYHHHKCRWLLTTIRLQEQNSPA